MKKQKKWMQSILSVLMAGIMLFGMAVTTLAEDAAPAAVQTGKVTIQNTVAGKNLNYYKIFSATKSGKAVAYTLEKNFEGFFTSDEKYGCQGKTDAALSQAAYAYVSKQTTAEQKRTLSREVLQWTLTNQVAGNSVTTADTQTEISDVAYGFYLFHFAGATNVEGITEPATPAMMINVTGDNVTISMKSSYPVIDKAVDDPSAAIGDTVTYTLTSHVPDMTGYQSYVFNFKDTFSAGLTFGAIEEVKVGAAVLEENTGYTLKQEANTIQIVLNNFIQYQNQVGAEVVVKYTATLNENAFVGMEPNTNRAEVEYSNDPTNPQQAVPSVPDSVDVHTFDFTVEKYFMDEDQKKPLEGVGFALYTDEACKQEVAVVQAEAGDAVKPAVYRKAKAEETGAKEILTPDSGKIQFKGLGSATYYLKETKTPDGYNPLTGPIKIVISPKYDSGKLTEYEVSYTYEDATTVVKSAQKGESPIILVENKTGAVLPNTGGVGAIIFTVAGIAILAVVMICSMRSKKRKHS